MTDKRAMMSPSRLDYKDVQPNGMGTGWEGHGKGMGTLAVLGSGNMLELRTIPS